MTPARRTLARVHVALACVVVLAWWLLTRPDGIELPGEWNDSLFYAGAGTVYWIRPWVAIVFWKSVGVTPLAVTLLCALSIACWARLGWVVLGVPGVLLGLTVSGAEIVRTWNYQVLSEPLAISGLAWFVGESLALRERDAARWYHYALWLASACLVTARLATVPLLAPGLIVVLTRQRWWFVPATALIALVPAWQQGWWGINTQYAESNLAIFRVAKDPLMLKWMTDRGFPWPIPEKYQGRFLDVEAASPVIPEYAAYLKGPFWRNYVAYLLRYPERTLANAFHWETSCVGNEAQCDATSLAGYFNRGYGAAYAIVDPLWGHDAVRWPTIGFWVVLIVGLMVEPWFALALLGELLLVYYGTVTEQDRYLAVVWVWQTIVLFVLLHAGWRWVRRHIEPHWLRWIDRPNPRGKPE